jgi:hypothetical protein
MAGGERGKQSQPPRLNSIARPSEKAKLSALNREKAGDSAMPGSAATWASAVLVGEKRP